MDAEPTIEAAVEPGDRVLIYTDGLTENFNLKREMLGVEGLSEIVRDASDLPLAAMNDKSLTASRRGGAALPPMTCRWCWSKLFSVVPR